LEQLKEILAGSETGQKGIDEISEVLDVLKELNLSTDVELDLTLARGLNYYTGAIFEVKALDVEIGSITGGGRYDDLTGIFGLKDVSGVGISFGADRIYDVMNQLDLYPPEVTSATQLMFVNFGVVEARYCLRLAGELRQKGLRVEVFPDNAKLKKQMNYAHKKNIGFVALVGQEEMNKGIVTLKDMNSGEQRSVKPEEIAEIIR
jgi:histidyl-tRNA synthetase